MKNRRVAALAVIALFAMMVLAAAQAEPMYSPIPKPIATGGVHPIAAALDEADDKAYVVHLTSDELVAVDTLTERIIGSAKTDIGPGGVAYNPVTDRVYVSHFGKQLAPSGTGTVKVYDGTSLALLATLSAGGYGGVGVAVDPVLNKVVVANSGSDNIAIIDGATNVVTNLTVGDYPFGVAINKVTHKAYVTNYAGASVSVINLNTNTVSSTLVDCGPTFDARDACHIGGPIGVGVNETLNQVWIAQNGMRRLSRIDGSTDTLCASTLPVNNPCYIPFPAPNQEGQGPAFLTVDSANNRVIASNYRARQIVIYDGATRANLGEVYTGLPTDIPFVGTTGLSGVTVDQSNGDIYIADSGPNAPFGRFFHRGVASTVAGDPPSDWLNDVPGLVLSTTNGSGSLDPGGFYKVLWGDF